MPLRLTQNETSLSGHTYDDAVGIRYEFPARYRKLIVPGERFVYYRGRRRASGGTQRPAYLGCGVVGDVKPSDRNPERLVCEVEDWAPFVEPLYFKDQSGHYYEPDAAGGGGYYWQVGVRRLDDATFERLVRDGAPVALNQLERSSGGRTPQYASQELLRAVDDYAMRVALGEMAERWPTEPVVRQPQSNPGFDIRIGSADAVIRYVEVKGTTFAQPRFFLSEGERSFSIRESDRYLLLVVYGIDLRQGSHRLFVHEGSLTANSFEFKVMQWACVADKKRPA